MDVVCENSLMMYEIAKTDVVIHPDVTSTAIYSVMKVSSPSLDREKVGLMGH